MSENALYVGVVHQKMKLQFPVRPSLEKQSIQRNIDITKGQHIGKICIKRFRYIEVLYHVFKYFGVQKSIRYTEHFVKCLQRGLLYRGSTDKLKRSVYTFNNDRINMQIAATLIRGDQNKLLKGI